MSGPADSPAISTDSTNTKVIGSHPSDGRILDLQEIYRSQSHPKVRARALKEIAQANWHDGKKHLAFLCFCESLRLDPDQVEVTPIVESFKGEFPPPVQVRFPEERCRVSIIVPTYNRPGELKEALASIVGQSFQDLEAIVVNDGGSDDSAQVVGSFGCEKIRYVKLPRNMGLSAARNQGLARARGKYIAYLDDDDIFYRDHLQTLVELLERSPDVDVAYANAWWVYGDLGVEGFIPREKKKMEYRPRTFDKNRLVQANFISTLNLVHRRDSLRIVGDFNEYLSLLEDWDLLLRMATRFKFQQVDEITGEYRWKRNNVSELRRAEMLFWDSIVGNYYTYFQGNLALAKSFCRCKEWRKAGRHLEAIQAGYAKDFKIGMAVKELSEVAWETRAVGFLRQVTKDYFEMMPRDCAKNAARKKSLVMASAIVPRIPKKILKKLSSKHGSNRRSREV